MTKEEIIDNLKYQNKKFYGGQSQTLIEAIKALEQPTNDCKIFGTKENCFGGATENECNHCDYKQALEQQPSDDCVSREKVSKLVVEWYLNDLEGNEQRDIVNLIDALPPVTPTHGTCKDCKHCGNKYANHRIYCSWLGGNFEENFYCKDFEKRGSENE